MPRGEACRCLQPRKILCHPIFPVAIAPKVCSTFAICLWISTFSSVCAVVLLPSIFPPHKSFLLVIRITVSERFSEIVPPSHVLTASELRKFQGFKVRRAVVCVPRVSAPGGQPAQMYCPDRSPRLDRRADQIVSLGGRSPARYCASNARSAAATLGPMPTTPSSHSGPKQCNPKIAAKEQFGAARCRRAVGMGRTIKVHLFDCRRRMAPTQSVALFVRSRRTTRVSARLDVNY